VYERTPDFEQRVAGARLRTYEWQFLANLDGHLTVGEILRRLKIDEHTIAEFILEQERNGAIAPRLLSFEEFLNSAEAETVQDAQPAAPAKPAAPASPNKHSTGEELRAIARLSIAAALGEILSLISKRRAASPAAAPAAGAPSKSVPAASAPAAPVQPSAAPAQPSAAPVQTSATPAPSSASPAAGADADWTLPRATASPVESPDANFEGELPQIDVEYLEAYSEDPVEFDEGAIAERLLRDYGPIDETEAPSNGASRLEDSPVAAESPSDTEPHRVTFSVNDLAGYVERVDIEAMPAPPNGFYPSEFARPDPAQAPYAEGAQTDAPHAEASQNDAPHADAAHDAATHDATRSEAADSGTPYGADATHAEPAHADATAADRAYAAGATISEQAQAPNGEASNGELAHAEDPQPKSDEFTVADPIVFSLSARNPDSFWSGKK
jgi:hypothetical protein